MEPAKRFLKVLFYVKEIFITNLFWGTSIVSFLRFRNNALQKYIVLRFYFVNLILMHVYVWPDKVNKPINQHKLSWLAWSLLDYFYD